MTELLIAGDWHGNHPWAKKVLNVALDRDIDTVVQVGDFGIWPGHMGEEYLNILSRYLMKIQKKHNKNIRLVFVPGNHEDWNQIDSWDMSKVNEDGHLEIRPHIFYAGKVNIWTWHNKRFASAGGAYSIDRKRRTPNIDWWKQEEFTNADLYMLKNLPDAGKIDYLFTHDAPTSIPMPGLIPDVNSDLHRQMMNRVGSFLRPSVWFHGHYHYNTGEYGFRHSEGYSSVYGLDADDHASAFHRAGAEQHNLLKLHTAILNVETGEVDSIE